MTLRIFIFFTCFISLFSQTIQEKKAELSHGAQSDLEIDQEQFLSEINDELSKLKQELRDLYHAVWEDYQDGVPIDDNLELLKKIQIVKQEIITLEESSRGVGSDYSEIYSLWQEGETSLNQLVMDYGSSDYLYLVPPDVGSIKVTIDSNLLVPKASWEKLLEVILSQNGVGIRQLTPYLRELYLFKENPSSMTFLTRNRQELEIIPDHDYVGFLITVPPMELKKTYQFLEKFSDQKKISLSLLGRELFLSGRVIDLKEVLRLYDFVNHQKGDKEFKVISLTKMEPEEMGKIIASIFDGLYQKDPTKKEDKDKLQPVFGLKVIPITNMGKAILLIGTDEEIRKAEEIAQEIEFEVGEPREKLIYWYQAKHTQPEELAETLQKVYALMVKDPTIAMSAAQGVFNQEIETLQKENETLRELEPEPIRLYQESFYQQGGYIINPAPIEPGQMEPPKYNKDRQNFIVDPKTNSIVMVVEAEFLPKIKDLIKKLDVPKKMVQIEVMLVEKKLVRDTNFGLNLLKVGTDASNTNSGSALWNNNEANQGVFSFLMSRKKTASGIPAFDFAYKFLISQDDVSINSCPTVLALNQTPAVIAIKDEISINTGVFQVETAKGVTLENAFTRAQYGVTISVTPTIHLRGDDDIGGEDYDSVTLKTDITFDSFKNALDSRPNVTRRNVKNEVRIADGQTVIIGGLRSKITNDFKESIPFLGEIPGFGKLFSITTMSDNEIEMFLLITPKIVSDPCHDLELIKYEEMKKRPGDIPEFMCQLVRSLEKKKYEAFQGTIRMMFGRECDRCVPPDRLLPCASEYMGE